MMNGAQWTQRLRNTQTTVSFTASHEEALKISLLRKFEARQCDSVMVCVLNRVCVNVSAFTQMGVKSPRWYVIVLLQAAVSWQRHRDGDWLIDLQLHSVAGQ